MRWINVLTFAILVLISGCKEEKLVVGQQAPALATFDLQGGLGLSAGVERLFI
jgi:hypothetical protein